MAAHTQRVGKTRLADVLTYCRNLRPLSRLSLSTHMSTAEKWRSFWCEQTTPLQPERISSQVYAKELRILFGETVPVRVLEIGCANGPMFELLGFKGVTYRGVDFSPRLLAAFKAKYPNVELLSCEGSNYSDGDKYDLIFSNAVVQYFDMNMLSRHFACAQAMMHKNSLFVCGSIPWRVHRSNYRRGVLTGSTRPNLLRLTRAVLASRLFGDSIGYWYQPHELVTLAFRHGLSAECYGSMVYLYRFHAVMKLR